MLNIHCGVDHADCCLCYVIVLLFLQGTHVVQVVAVDGDKNGTREIRYAFVDSKSSSSCS